MSELTIGSSNFESEVKNSEKPVLLDFWATWCGPCKMMSPVVSGIASEYDGKLTVGKVNVDEESELAVKYGISAIPTLVLIKDGEKADVSVGFSSKSEVKEWLSKNGI